MTPADDWTDAERNLWDAYRRGNFYDLRGQDGDRVVRAEVLGQLVLGGGETAPGRVARLRASGVRVTGQLDLRDADLDLLLLFVDCVFDAPIMLSGASLRLLLDRSTLAGLIAQDAHVLGSLLARQVRVTGPVRLRGCRVNGTVDFSGATLANPHGDALLADNLTVDGDVIADNGFTATGRVSFAGARIGGNLSLGRGTITNPDGPALVLLGAQIGGDLDLTDATLLAEQRAALVFVEGTARRLRMHLAATSAGNIALTDARIGRLHLRQDAWPPACSIELDGFSIERIVPQGPWPARARVDWIERHTTHYTPTAYEQFAATYRREGHEADARLVLRNKERRRHHQLGPLGRVWGWVQHVTVGFGYAPGRALLWLAALLAVGTAYFAENRLAPVVPGEAPAWQPLVYTLDLIVPLVDIGHERAYDPTGGDQVVALTLVVLGWVLAAAVVAGASRTLKRQ